MTEKPELRATSKRRTFLGFDLFSRRACLLVGLAIAIRLLEVCFTSKDITEKNAKARLQIEQETGAKRPSWRTTFPKRPDLLNVSNAVEPEFCIFVCISPPTKHHTMRFSDDLWNWTKTLTMWGLAGQTHSDFQVFVDFAGDLSELSPHRMLDVQHKQCTSQEVSRSLEMQNRNCSWVVTTRVDPGSFVKAWFVADVVKVVRQSVWQVPHIQAILVSSRQVRQVTVDGEKARRCEIANVRYEQGGGPSGQTLAVHFESWQKKGGLTVGESDYDKLWDEAIELYASPELPVMPVALPGPHGFEIITRLNGVSFPWADGLPKCDDSARDAVLGIPLFTKFARVPVPKTPFLDVCESHGNFQEQEETTSLFNNSDQDCREAKGFFWETGGDGKRRRHGGAKKQFCTFVQVTGPPTTSPGPYAEEFWEWTEAMSLKTALANQTHQDFRVILNPPETHKFSSVPVDNLSMFRTPQTAQSISDLLPQLETDVSCQWVVTVHLPGGGYLHDGYIYELHTSLRGILAKHRQLDAVIVAYERAKQVTVDGPAGRGSPIACRSTVVKYDDAGGSAGRAIAVKARYFREGRGSTAVECERFPVGCVQKKGVPKRKIAHGHLQGTGIDLVTRLSPAFSWERPPKPCHVEVQDEAVGYPVLAAAQAAEQYIPKRTTLYQACMADPAVAEALRSSSRFKGMSCELAAESLVVGARAKRQKEARSREGGRR